MLFISKNFTNCLRFYSTKTRGFKEIKIPVQWGHIAGKWWEPYDTRPILTTHGWQDNCGSFDRLIPQLKPDVGFLTIDLPGHGYSSKLPAGMFYNNMNYPILIKGVANYFQWPKVSLMGHSLGSISNYCYTMLFPETVDFIVCIDGLKPLQKKNNAPRMAIGIEELLKYDQLAASNQEPPSYDLDVIKRKISEFNDNSIDYEHADVILKRNLAPSKINKDKFYVTRDPRLKSRLILNWPHEELVKYAERVTCPIFMTKSSKSGYYENKQNLYDVLEVLKKSSVDCQYHYVEGTHHVHLNKPEVVSGIINDFLAKHCIGDRKGGGIKDEIKV